MVAKHYDYDHVESTLLMVITVYYDSVVSENKVMVQIKLQRMINS